MSWMTLHVRYRFGGDFAKTAIVRADTGWRILGPCYPHNGEPHDTQAEAMAAFHAHAQRHADRIARRQHREN